MHNDDSPLFVTRKIFVRRLATRLLASALAMAAMNALSAPHGIERSFVEPGPPAPALRSASDAPDRVAALAASRTGEGRTGRLLRFAPGRNAERIATAFATTARAAKAPGNVIAFDRCMPGCDSRDPLIAANRVAPSEDPSPAPVEEAATVLLADGGETARAPERPDGLVRVAYQGIRSLARAGGRSIGSGLEAVAPW